MCELNCFVGKGLVEGGLGKALKLPLPQTFSLCLDFDQDNVRWNNILKVHLNKTLKEKKRTDRHLQIDAVKLQSLVHLWIRIFGRIRFGRIYFGRIRFGRIYFGRIRFLRVGGLRLGPRVERDPRFDFVSLAAVKVKKTKTILTKIYFLI